MKHIFELYWLDPLPTPFFPELTLKSDPQKTQIIMFCYTTGVMDPSLDV